MADMSTENVHESKVATPREMILTFFREVDEKKWLANEVAIDYY